MAARAALGRLLRCGAAQRMRWTAVHSTHRTGASCTSADATRTFFDCYASTSARAIATLRNAERRQKSAPSHALPWPREHAAAIPASSWLPQGGSSRPYCTKRKIVMDFEIPPGQVLFVTPEGREMESRDAVVTIAEEKGLHAVQVGVQRKSKTGEILNMSIPVVKLLSDEEIQKLIEPRSASQSDDEEGGKKVKEVRFGHNIAEGDVQTKVNKGIKFLQKGLRVRVMVIFQRRWEYDDELANALMENILERFDGYYKLITEPRADDRSRLTALIGPSDAIMEQVLENEARAELRKKKKKRAIEEVDEDEQDERDRNMRIGLRRRNSGRFRR